MYVHLMNLIVSILSATGAEEIVRFQEQQRKGIRYEAPKQGQQQQEKEREQQQEQEQEQPRQQQQQQQQRSSKGGQEPWSLKSLMENHQQRIYVATFLAWLCLPILILLAYPLNRYGKKINYPDLVTLLQTRQVGMMQITPVNCTWELQS